MDIGKEYIDSRKKNGIAAEYVDIDSLKLAPDNPRINEHVVEKVAKSIQSYGFAAPIVAQLDGTILAGHTRYKAAKSLNILKVPCRYMDISGDKAKLYRIADNKLGELAEWDDEELYLQLEELNNKGLGLELEELGFDLAMDNEAYTKIGKDPFDKLDGYLNRENLKITIALEKEKYTKLIEYLKVKMDELGIENISETVFYILMGEECSD